MNEHLLLMNEHLLKMNEPPFLDACDYLVEEVEEEVQEEGDEPEEEQEEEDEQVPEEEEEDEQVPEEEEEEVNDDVEQELSHQESGGMGFGIKTLLIFLVLLALFVSIFLSLWSKPALPLLPREALFDHYMLVLQWPLTFCQFHRCRREYPHEFTIHGLWPQTKYMYQPLENCDDDHKDHHSDFPSKSLSEKLPSLKYVWVNLFGADENLWRVTWLKHGTCSPYFKRKNPDIIGYFALGLNLRERVKLFVSELETREIYPARWKQYHFSMFQQAIKDIAGVTPQLRCQDSMLQKDKRYLWEVRFCVDAEENLYDCSATDSSCGDKFIFPVEILKLHNTSLIGKLYNVI